MAALQQEESSDKSTLIPQSWRELQTISALAPNVPKILLTTVMLMVVFHQLDDSSECLGIGENTRKAKI